MWISPPFHIVCIAEISGLRHGSCVKRRIARGVEVIMKTHIVRIAILVGAVLLGAVAATAQSTTTTETFLRANIPFGFVAGGVHLPAGEYRVYHPGNPYIVIIEKKDCTARAVTYVRPSAFNRSENNTKLLFNRYGDQYFLAEVWTERGREMHQCFKCRIEQDLIAKRQKPKTVVVAAAY